MAQKKILIFLPTFNEVGNVGSLFAELLKLNLGNDFLFIDDNSADGTGKILDEIASQHSSVNVIHRPGRLGIGSAHFDGITWAYKHGYQILITMDSDFAHSPEYVLELLKQSDQYDLVIGSRWLKAGSLVEWNLFRRFLTGLGHYLTVSLLKVHYDATGAFRLMRLENIPEGVFGLVKSKAYSFFFESLFIMVHNDVNIGEIPIFLPNRVYGESKMQWRHILGSLFNLARLYLRSVFFRTSVRQKVSYEYEKVED